MKVTKNLNIKMNQPIAWSRGPYLPDKERREYRWNRDNRDDGGCAGRKGCDPVFIPVLPRVDRYNRLDKKVTPIVKEQAKTLSF